MVNVNELVNGIRPDQAFDDPVQVFDLTRLDRDTVNAWLTYCAMRRTLAYFLALHPEIEPMAYATEHPGELRNVWNDLVLSGREQEERIPSSCGCA